MSRFLTVFKPYISSFYFLGTWLICYVPFILVIILSSECVKLLAMGSEDIAKFLVYIIYLGVDTIGIIVVTMGLSYGIRKVMHAPPPDKKGSTR